MNLHRLSPGFIPRVSLLAGSEPRPDYGSPPVSQKPAFQRPASMNMDYGRHGSPNYDFHGQQYPRTSYGSYDSVMVLIQLNRRWGPPLLTLSHTTNFRLFQTEIVCRRQF